MKHPHSVWVHGSGIAEPMAIFLMFGFALASTFLMSTTSHAHPLPSLENPLFKQPLVAPKKQDKGPVIEIVVVGPGDQFYSLYGHLGVLVWEDDRREPAVGKLFNFGMTNFSEDGYFGNFLGGRVRFWGDVRPYKKYLKMWTKQDRSITRYRLNLSPAVSRAMYRQLKSSIAPKNRYFLYDTFRQNCSTKVRDLVDAYTAGALYQALNDQPAITSYRDNVREGYSRQIALLFLTEWFLGSSTDQPRTPWELSYRPVYFGEQLTSIRLRNGAPLVSEWTIEHERSGEDPTQGWYHWLAAVLSTLTLIFVLIHFGVVSVSNRQKVGLAALVGFPLVLLSCFHMVMQYWTSWPDARNSWMLLCVCPLDGLVLFAVVRSWLKKHPISDGVRLYARTRFIMTMIVCVMSFMPFGSGPLAPRLFVLGWWLLVADWRFGSRQQRVEESSPSTVYTAAM